MAAWDITWKDLRLLAKDKRALVLLILLPMMFISILGMSTGQFLTTNDAARKLKIAVVDEDQSDPSRELIKALSQHDDILVSEKPNETAARQALDKSEAMVVMTIPDTYEEKVETLGIKDVFDSANGQLKNGTSDLGLKFESRSAVDDGGMVKSLVFFDALRTISPVVLRKNIIVRRILDRDDSTEEAEVAPEDAATDETAKAPVPKPNGKVAEKTSDKIYMILVPGFTVMFVFFLINIMARSFIAEREQGTLRRLRLAPVSAASVLIGKTLPFYLTSVLQVSMLFIAGRMLFNMSWGPEPVYLIPVILCTSLAATSLGLLLATLVHTDQQVSSFGTSIVLVLGGISGCMFPRIWLPSSMRTVSLLTPHAWALEAFDAALTRSTVDHMVIFDCCAMLLAFAATFFLCGWLRFRVAN